MHVHGFSLSISYCKKPLIPLNAATKNKPKTRVEEWSCQCVQHILFQHFRKEESSIVRTSGYRIHVFLFPGRVKYDSGSRGGRIEGKLQNCVKGSIV